MSSPFPIPATTPETDTLPDAGATPSEIPDDSQPKPSPMPVYGQTSTWLARTVESGDVVPTFVAADPPPPSPWEEGVDRPALEIIPTLAAATVSPPPVATTTVRANIFAQFATGTPTFSENFSVDDTPDLLNPNPNPAGPNPAQSPTALDVSGLPLTELT